MGHCEKAAQASPKEAELHTLGAQRSLRSDWPPLASSLQVVLESLGSSLAGGADIRREEGRCFKKMLAFLNSQVGEAEAALADARQGDRALYSWGLIIVANSV